MQDDSNHKLDASLRFACTRVLARRTRVEAALVKRRTVSEFIRGLLEAHFAAKDALERTP